jgi:FkbM family methyltransferase
MALLHRLCMRDRISIDIGANYGIYSYYMLKFSSGCIAFEPYPRLARLLRQGLGRQLQVHEAALSNRSGSARMVASDEQSAYNTTEPTNEIESKVTNPGSITTLDVPVRTLDEFDLGPVGLIKIDVHGHEEEVLEGGRNTIAEYSPSLIVELEEQHRPGCRDRVVNTLGKSGYTALFLHGDRLRPAYDFDPETHQNPDRPEDYIRNLIFLPPHRVEDFATDMNRGDA